MPGLSLALLLLVPPTWLGAGALHALGIRPRDDRLAYLGWAWMLGALGTGGVLFVTLLAGLAPDRAFLVGAVIGLGGALFLTGRALAGTRADAGELEPEPLAAAPGWERALFALALAAVLALGVGWILAATQRPVMEGDEAGVWNLRAKVIWDAGDLRGDFRAAMDAEPRFPVHKDYPLLNPLLQAWAFTMAGEPVHASVRFPVQVLLLALVLALAAALVRRVRPSVAALLLLAWIATPQAFDQFHETKADHMVALGLLVALDAWSRGARTAERHPAGRGTARWMALTALGATTMVVSKHEGLPVLLAFAAALLLGARSELRAVLRGGAARVWAALPALALLGVWGFDRAFGFHNMVARGAPGGGPSFFETLRAEWVRRLGVVLPFYRDEVLGSARETNLAFLLFFALLVLGALELLGRRVPRRAAAVPALAALAAALIALGPVLGRAGAPLALAVPAWGILAALVALGLAALEPAHRAPALTVTFGLILLVAIYLGTTLSLGVAWHLGTSGVRTAHQLLPAALLWTAAEASRRFPAVAPRSL